MSATARSLSSRTSARAGSPLNEIDALSSIEAWAVGSYRRGDGSHLKSGLEVCSLEFFISQ